MRTFSGLISRLRNNSLFKDSFWAVGGNGIGNALMLFSGIFIARTIGKDLYGEYGMVKTTMFLMALFSTFALGDTSTKFIAEYIQKDVSFIRKIIHASFRISFVCSATLCVLLVIFSKKLAVFINTPQLEEAFKFLGIIIVFRSINTVGAGILGGFKAYKKLGINNIIAGVTMLTLAIPGTLYWSLYGALCALLLSQVTLSILNTYQVYKFSKMYLIPNVPKGSFEKELLLFSYPFALNELVYSLSSWGCSLLVAKYATIGDLGMLSACNQWNAIILFMPGLLGNVVLSYLSTTAVSNMSTHKMIIRRMLIVNFVCTFIPFVMVIMASGYIADYYGPTFKGMEMVLGIKVLCTIFMCLTRVYQSNLMSEGKKWLAFYIRSSYNILDLLLTYIVLLVTDGRNAAINLSWSSLFICVISLLLYSFFYHYSNRKETHNLIAV